MRRIIPALYVIIALALVVSICGCDGDRQFVNDTVQQAKAPLEHPTASVASPSHTGSGSQQPKPTPTTSPKSTVKSTPAPVLTAGSKFPCIHATPDRTSEGIVTKITDGDTIHVLINGKDYTVRYIGIDTPEDTKKKEPMGAEATARDKELVAGKKVILVKDVSETDKYGRLLRFVFVGNILVNYELVREGYAKATPYSPDTSCKQIFYDAQQLAQQEHRGLWKAGSAS